MRDFTPPFDNLGCVAIRKCEREPELVAKVLRQSIGRPGAIPLSAILVRTAIGLELSRAFPAVALQRGALYEIAERLRLGPKESSNKA
jgi:hypothetical protein